MTQHDFGQWRALAQQPPSKEAWQAIVEALIQWSDTNAINEAFKQEVIPYLQSHLYQWPAHVRYLSADLLDPGDTPEVVLILVGATDTFSADDVARFVDMLQEVGAPFHTTVTIEQLSTHGEDDYDSMWAESIEGMDQSHLKAFGAEQYFMDDVLGAVLAKGTLPNVEHIAMQVQNYGAYESGYSLGDFGEVYKPKLKTLAFEGNALNQRGVHDLVDAYLPQLTQLRAELITGGVLGQIVEANWMPQITRLDLVMEDFPDEEDFDYEQWRIDFLPDYEEEGLFADGKSLITDDLQKLANHANSNNITHLSIDVSTEASLDLTAFEGASGLKNLKTVHLSCELVDGQSIEMLKTYLPHLETITDEANSVISLPDEHPNPLKHTLFKWTPKG